MMNLIDTIRGIRNNILFPIRNRIRISRQNYFEPPAKEIRGLKPNRLKRVQELSKKYSIKFENMMALDNALQNYDYLDLLDQLSTQTNWSPPQNKTLIDAGSRTFYYAAALSCFFHPEIMTGIELDAYRLYDDFHTRYSYAQFFIKPFGNTSYEVADFFKNDYQADIYTYFYPFVLPTEMLRWGLPSKSFQPQQYFEKAKKNLSPQGHLIMVNCGEDEFKEACRLAQMAGLKKLGAFIQTKTILDRETPPYVSLWEK